MATVHKLEVPATKPVARREPVRLTEDVLKKIKPGERVYDKGTPGFSALGLKSGVSFVVQADLPTAARRWGTPKTMVRVVGRWPDDFSPKEARPIAADYIAKIKRGEDPVAKVPEGTADEGKPDTWTLKMAFDNFMTKKERDGLGESSLLTYRHDFKRVPVKWHSRPIKEVIVDGDALRTLHESIRNNIVLRKGRNANEDSGKNAADATIKFLGRVSDYARAKSNGSLPLWNDAAVDLFGQRTREENGMGLNDLSDWWKGVSKVRNPIRRELGLFMLLTGLRSRDARTASETHLNEADKTLFIPTPKGENKKRGRRRAFTLPLSDAALACIHRARALNRTTTKLLFPNLGGNAFTDADLGNNAGGHDLRHSFETIGEDLGIEETVIARLLNHSPRSQTGKYGHPDKIIASPREAMDRISVAIMKEIKL